MQNENKKLYIIIASVIVVLIAATIAVIALTGSKEKTAAPASEEVAEASTKPKKKRIAAPQNVIALAKRPVVSLHPFSKDGGRFVSIVVSALSEKADSAEYEIVYNVIGANAVDAKGKAIRDFDAEAEGGLQAFIGELDLARLPTSTENRFGTCSAGGACINNNVDYGTLTLNFDTTEKFGVKTNWTYFEDGAATSSTHDELFTIKAKSLENASDYLIMQQIGLPEGLDGTVVEVTDDGRDGGTWPLAYQLSFTKAPADLDEATVSFDHAGDKVAVYDGKHWKTYSVDDTVPAGDDYIYALLGDTAASADDADAD